MKHSPPCFFLLCVFLDNNSYAYYFYESLHGRAYNVTVQLGCTFFALLFMFKSKGQCDEIFHLLFFVNWGFNILYLRGPRRRIKTEDKAKVVSSV